MIQQVARVLAVEAPGTGRVSKGVALVGGS